MSSQRKVISLKSQIGICAGFLILFTGLLLNFYGEEYSMFKASKNLFILIDSLGGFIILLSVFFAFYSRRSNLSEVWRSIAIETSMMFAFMFSIQATLFHLLFTYYLSPVNLGVFFIFAAYFFAITALIMSFTDALIRKYYGLLLGLFTVVFFGTLTSGIFLTFTGAIEPIIDNGMGVFIVGVISIPILLVVYITFPKWKAFMQEYYKEEDADEELEDM